MRNIPLAGIDNRKFEINYKRNFVAGKWNKIKQLFKK